MALFWSLFFGRIWKHFKLHLEAHFDFKNDLWRRPGKQQANLRFHRHGQRKRASGPLQHTFKGSPKSLQKLRHFETDFVSVFDTNLKPKMHSKWVRKSGGISDTFLQGFYPLFAAILTPKMARKWTPKS